MQEAIASDVYKMVERLDDHIFLAGNISDIMVTSRCTTSAVLPRISHVFEGWIGNNTLRIHAKHMRYGVTAGDGGSDS